MTEKEGLSRDSAKASGKSPPPKMGKLPGTKPWTPYLLALPALAVVVLVLLVPISIGAYTSLFEADQLTPDDEFVGLGNYLDLVGDRNFRNALGNSARIVIVTLTVGFLLSLAGALVMFHLKFAQRFLRALSLIPFFISGVALGTMWRFLFAVDGGLANIPLLLLGVEPISWLSDPTRSLVAVMVINIWHITPLAALILLGGLLSIESDLREAASVDGANALQKFLHIDLPGIRPQIGLSLVWLSFASFSVFAIILPLTGGGPGRSTEVMSMVMYERGITQLQYGRGATIMVVFLLINAFVSVVLMRLFGGSLVGSQTKRVRRGG